MRILSMDRIGLLLWVRSGHVYWRTYKRRVTLEYQSRRPTEFIKWQICPRFLCFQCPGWKHVTPAATASNTAGGAVVCNWRVSDFLWGCIWCLKSMMTMFSATRKFTSVVPPLVTRTCFFRIHTSKTILVVTWSMYKVMGASGFLLGYHQASPSQPVDRRHTNYWCSQCDAQDADLSWSIMIYRYLS